MLFGIAHFVYMDLTVPLVPKWLPPNVRFWAVATGVFHIAAGLAIVSGVWSPVRFGAADHNVRDVCRARPPAHAAGDDGRPLDLGRERAQTSPHRSRVGGGGLISDIEAEGSRQRPQWRCTYSVVNGGRRLT